VDELDRLLGEAAAADPSTRIEFRDRIALFGSEAIVRLEPWLSDAHLGAFAVRTIEHAAAMPGAALTARAALLRANVGGPVQKDIRAALARLPAGARTRTSRGDQPAKGRRPKRKPDEVFRDLRDLLIENADRRQLMAYSDTGLNRNMVGKLLDDINRSEHEQGRPLISVIVVHKGQTMPGEGFFMCAKALGLYQEGDDRAAFVRREREAVFKAWE
jgi:hypothetical protein